MTLKGFTVPLTPQGNSALASVPPWHYSSDCIAIEYWTNPDPIQALLPPGVAVDQTSKGRAFFWFLDWQFTGSNDELTDPARHRAWLVAGISEETRQRLSDTQLLGSQSGRGTACQGKPLRSKCLGARRTFGNGAYSARGERRRSC